MRRTPGAASSTASSRPSATCYGYRHVVPTHQGRGAEHLISPDPHQAGSVRARATCTSPRPGRTRSSPAASSPTSSSTRRTTRRPGFRSRATSTSPSCAALIERVGAANIAYVNVAVTVNMAGGQPVSMATCARSRDVCRRHGILLWCDATRLVENAFFIKEREEGYAETSDRRHRPRDDVLLRRLHHVRQEGRSGQHRRLPRHERRERPAAGAGTGRAVRGNATPTAVWPDGTWRRWPSASGRWSTTGTSRTASTRSAISASSCSTPVCRSCEPIGGHAVFLDARRFLPHLTQEQLPGPDARGPALPRQRGPRDGARHRVGRTRPEDRPTTAIPKLELVRLTIPRRVYTDRHMDVVAASVIASVPAPRGDPRPPDGLRATDPALLQCPLRPARGVTPCSTRRFAPSSSRSGSTRSSRCS